MHNLKTRENRLNSITDNIASLEPSMMITIRPSIFIKDSLVEKYLDTIMRNTGYSDITATREMNYDKTVQRYKSKSHFHVLVTFNEKKSIDEISKIINTNISGKNITKIENREVIVSKPLKSLINGNIVNFDKKYNVTAREIKGNKAKIFIEEVLNAKSSAIYSYKFSGLEIAQYYIKGSTNS